VTPFNAVLQAPLKANQSQSQKLLLHSPR